MISWDQALQIIESKELAKLVRTEDQLKKYQRAKEQFRRSHGSTAGFVIAERLKWTNGELKSSGDPFLQNWHDIKILVNDFSYAFEAGIQHFVVWLKTPIPCGPDELPTEEAQQAIEEFLNKYLVKACGIPRSDLAWFKNTSALQSIPSVSHFHVLVRNCTPELEEKILALPQ